MKLVTIIFAVLLINTSIVSAKSLNRGDIEQSIIGKNFSFVTPRGGKGNVRYSKNGKARLSNTNFKPKSDSGTWKIKGNKHCITWRKVREGKEACFSYKTAGPGKFKNQHGSILIVK